MTAPRRAMASRTTQDLDADEREVPPRPRRTGLMIGGALGLGVIVAAVAIAMQHAGGAAVPDAAVTAVPVVMLPPPPPPVVPAPVQAALDVEVDPPSAAVLLDGQPAVVADGHVRANVAPGPHVVSVSARGYRAVEQTVSDHAAIHLERVAVAAKPVVMVPPPPPSVKPAGDVDGVVDPFHKPKAGTP
jgi:hypothetical protein